MAHTRLRRDVHKNKNKGPRSGSGRQNSTRAVRLILKVFGILLATVVCFIALLYLINAFDQNLRPEVIASAAAQTNDTNPAQNAYFAVLGHTAPAVADPHRKGIEVVEAHNRLVQPFALASDIPDVRVAALGQGRLEFLGKSTDLCDRSSARCLPAYKKRERDIEEMLRSNRVLVDRYYRLYRYTRFEETAKFSMRLLSPFDDANTQALVRATIGLKASRGQTHEALRALKADTRYQRMVLHESTTLVTKMIATLRMRRNLLLLSEIVARSGSDVGTRKLAEGMLVPLSAADLDMHDVFINEFRFGKLILESANWHDLYADDEVPRSLQFILKPLYKRNATINQFHERHTFLAQLARKPLAELYEELASGRAEAAYDQPFLTWHAVYNPLGKMTAGVMPLSSWVPYMGRTKNLDALMRLITLQVLAKQRGIHDSEMPQFLAQVDAALKNPYTAEPAQWDPEKRSIYFMCLQEDDKTDLMGKRVEVLVGPV